MLRSLSEIIGYELLTRDGKVGTCKDFLFDDRWWTIRYMLADTGNWLPGRKVLVSPLFIERPDWHLRKILMNLTKEQIENCPPLNEDMPVSKEYEMHFLDYYSSPFYWTGGYMWGSFPTPVISGKVQPPDKKPEPDTDENHLRSVSEVRGYGISAHDGDMGHAEDFIINDQNWALEYMVVDTRNWLPGGKKVLFSVKWIRNVTWVDSSIAVNMTRDTIENSPEFDPAQPINREFEIRLYDYYGRPLK